MLLFYVHVLGSCESRDTENETIYFICFTTILFYQSSRKLRITNFVIFSMYFVILRRLLPKLIDTEWPMCFKFLFFFIVVLLNDALRITTYFQ